MLVCSLPKIRNRPFDSRCKLVRVEVVLEDVGVGKNVAKMCVAWKYYPAHPRTKLLKKCLWVGGSCWARGIDLEFATKVWARKKNSSYRFSQLPIIKCFSQTFISLCPLPPFERAKQDTIRVIEGTNAKLLHHKGLVPTYQMESEMPFVHHVVKW